MFESKPRKETNCLNCGAEVSRRFCPECGQENVEQVSTVTGLIVGIISKFTHLDGKFVATIKELILRPGFIAYEFINFRRRKYLDPLSMFFTVTALSILITLYFDAKEQSKYAVQNDPVLKHMVDSARIVYADADRFTSCGIKHNNITANAYAIPMMYRHGITYYDSVQQTLPVAKRSNWLQQHFEYKLIRAWTEYDADPYTIDYKAGKRFYGSFANSMLLSIGMFSILLYILYIRRRQDYSFFSHVIFSLNYFTVVWIFLTLHVLIQYLINITVETRKYPYATWIILPGLMLYLFVSMRRFYKQNYFKTSIKFIMLAALFIVLFVVSTLILFFNSLLNIGGS